MLNVLRLDSGNDTSLTVLASVLVYDSKSIGKKEAEFGGIIIYPFRKDNQIIFLEAKNIDHSYSKGKNALQKNSMLLTLASTRMLLQFVIQMQFLNIPYKNDHT